MELLGSIVLTSVLTKQNLDSTFGQLEAPNNFTFILHKILFLFCFFLLHMYRLDELQKIMKLLPDFTVQSRSRRFREGWLAGVWSQPLAIYNALSESLLS